MTRSSRIFLLQLVGVALLTSPARARGQAVASPILTAVIALGYATGSGGEYFERAQYVWHAGADVRVARIAHADLLVRVNGDVTEHLGDYSDVCQRGSQGQCLPSFPVMRGGSVEVGMRGALSRAITIIGSAGMGVYRAMETAFDAASETSRAWTVSADAAVAVTRHVQLVLGGRRVAGVEIGGARIGFNAVTLGLQGRWDSPR